jgi:hypothetical protein
VVSSSEVLMLCSDDQATNFIFAGKALLQSGSPFSNAALNGSSVLYIANTNNMEIGTITADGNGGSQFLTWRDGDGVSRQGSATYSVAPNGRVNLTSFNGLTQPVLWLVNTNQAFLVGNQSGEMGMLEPQTSTSANGNYTFGTIDPIAGYEIQSGVTALSGGTVNTTTDKNPGPPSMDQAASQTYSIDSTGLGSIPSGCSFGTNCQSIFYVISPTRTVFLNLQFQVSGQPTSALQVADQ